MKEEKNKLLEYHKEHMHTYRAIDKVTHNTHFKPVVRGGEPYIAPIDENGNEIKI